MKIKGKYLSLLNYNSKGDEGLSGEKKDYFKVNTKNKKLTH